MSRSYRHLMQSDGSYTVQEVREDGTSRIIAPDHPTYVAWLEAGGEPAVVAYAPPAPPSLKDAQTDRKTAATALRQAKVAGGFLYEGTLLGTDDADRAILQGTESYLAKKPTGSKINWRAKGGSSWIELDLDSVRAIGVAIGDFVQACFDAERAHCQAIDALATPEAVAAYDISSGWPA